jgi:hydroxyethylthiazole kinase-like uncharacterized protein yjeF
MERAGEAVAAAAAALAGEGSIVVLAGPGNNGGDGFVAARLLRHRGFRVQVALHGGGRDGLHGDCALAAGRFSGEVFDAAPAAFEGASLVIDGLFGAGFRPPLSAEAGQLIQAVNRSGARVLAIDLPSGLRGDGGLTDGPVVEADETVTFFRLKPAHLLFPGRARCGRVRVADIGIPASTLREIAPRTFHNVPALWRRVLPALRPAGHKYDRGHLLVLSGPAGRGGAARLAATAGLRAGAGLVTLAAPAGALAEHAAQLTAVMLREANDPRQVEALLADRRINAVVLGPGLGVGAATVDLVHAVLESRAAVVLDADAITSFVGAADRLAAEVLRREAPTVVTPHGGEFARIVPDLVGPSKLENARAAARRSGAIVVLKGADTVVAAPDERASIADNAPPSLATAGSGDVLAGIVGAMLAQGMPAFEAAAAAVWLHGEAGQEAGIGLTAEDLAPALRPVLRRLVAGGD